MSINQKMEEYILQRRIKTESLTGGELVKWVDHDLVDVAIYKTNDTLNTQSVRYNESTHTGITREKEIQEHEYRLKGIDGTIYNITSANAVGRMTTLLLKVVDMDA